MLALGSTTRILSWTLAFSRGFELGAGSSRTVNQHSEPFPNPSLNSPHVPPISSDSCLMMLSPRPVPCCFCFRSDCSTCSKREKRRCRSDGRMPRPLSLQETLRMVPVPSSSGWVVAVTMISPPLSVNLMALERTCTEAQRTHELVGRNNEGLFAHEIPAMSAQEYDGAEFETQNEGLGDIH